MTITVTDSETNCTMTLPDGVTMYDVSIALKQLADSRRRSLKENRGPKKNYYVPTGKPRGRPRKVPADFLPAAAESAAEKIDPPSGV
jgi:hypothetical protein